MVRDLRDLCKQPARRMLARINLSCRARYRLTIKARTRSCATNWTMEHFSRRLEAKAKSCKQTNRRQATEKHRREHLLLVPKHIHYRRRLDIRAERACDGAAREKSHFQFIFNESDEKLIHENGFFSFCFRRFGFDWLQTLRWEDARAFFEYIFSGSLSPTKTKSTSQWKRKNKKIIFRSSQKVKFSCIKQ